MGSKTARASVEPVRQRTQYSCMAASMAMCLRANDHNVTEDEVNAVMGARPMKGAAWEQALATAQHYGCRATLTMPATVEQLKAWTDQGVPIMIAWNPEGRPWSHASVVFDVDDDLNVYVADPNIPNPKETVRVVSENDFYGKWYEKFPDYLVRRPACAIEREVTEVGQQIMPRTGDDPTAFVGFQGRTASGGPYVTVKKLRDGSVVVNAGAPSNASARRLIEKAGYDFRLIEDRAGSWVFPKGMTTADKLVKALAGVDAVLKTASIKKTAEPYDCYKDGLRGRELADCYKRFPDDLGPRDIALIQQYYPGWGGGGGGGYSRPPATPLTDLQERADKAILALVHRGGDQKKNIGFLWSVRTWALKGRPPTAKQQRWWDGLVQRTESFARKIPGKVKLDHNPNGLIFMGRGSDGTAVKWVSDHFEMSGPFLDGPKQQAPTPAPVTPSGGGNKGQLEALDELLARRPDGFIQSIRDQVARGRALSEKQLKAVRQNFYRNRMRDKADLFRAAAESHEARAKRKNKPESMKTKMKVDKTAPKPRNDVAKAMAERNYGSGKHHNRDRDVATGRSRKPKHKNKQMEASIDRLTAAFLRMASSSFWKSMSGQIKGWKHVDEEILAWLTWEDTYDTVKDRNIPDLNDVADPEMLADGIPELMESYSNAARDHAQWVRQGWWPKRVKVPNGGLHLMILFRPRSKGFEARFPKKDMRKALAMGEQAAEVIRGSKYPRWMKPVKTGAYSGNPDGKPIYDVKVDHGEHQPLSGGTDVMKRLQDRYRIEQGHAPRDGNPQLTNETATQKVAWDWKKDGIPPRDSRLIGTRPGQVLQQWGEHHSGAPFAIIPRDTRGMRGPQDKYQKVVIQNGVITHDFGSVPQLVRQARSSSNTPARVGRAVNQLALRFVAAQVEALR